MNKLLGLALLLSFGFFAYALISLDSDACVPYFVDSKIALESDAQMQMINRNIGMQDEILKKKEQAFTDSIMGLFDSLSVRNEKDEALVELLNLESNVFRHKMIDSISRASQVEVNLAVKSFNKKVIDFCQKKEISILFGSNNNTIVYGSGTKVDKTKELVDYLGGTHE